MDPNSAHQLWSKWIVTVRPNIRFQPSFETVQANTVRFVRKGFGSGGQFKLEQFAKAWVVTFLVDAQRHPNDPETFKYFGRAFTMFFQNAFGSQAEVVVKARLLAGARLDGRPPDQLIMMPSILPLAEE